MMYYQPRVDAGAVGHAGGTWLGVNEFGVVRIFNRQWANHRFAALTYGRDREPYAMILALTEEIQMCGRFTFQPTEAFYKRFEITNRLDSLIARYNIAPGQMVPVIIANSPRRIVLMRWGLIPHWAKDDRTAYKMINARVETLIQKPTFRGLLSHNRCLVPASGFYEWRAEGRDKTPYYIHPQGEQFCAFAGLYDVWINPQGEEVYTFTIITTEADSFMARLHNRMPVVLEKDLEDAWLDPELTKAQDVLAVLSRSTGLELEAYPVSRLVNRPSVDSSVLIQPAG